MNRLLRCVVTALILGGCYVPVLRALEEKDLKDETGKVTVHFFVDAPANVAPASVTDPAKQVGVIVCLQEHTEQPQAGIYPVRMALKRLGLADKYVLLAFQAQSGLYHPEKARSSGGLGAADIEPIQKVVAWAKKMYAVNPRRIYAFGKGSGGSMAGQLSTLHSDVFTASVSYSWGWTNFVSELDKPIDMVNSAPELYLVLGMRDFTHHITQVRNTYEFVRAKGYHVIYREFDELGDRAYHHPSNDDALSWATRLRNKTIPPSPEEMNLLKAFSGDKPPAPVSGYYPSLALVGGAQAGEVLQKLFQSSDANVRLAAAETCNHGIYSEATTAALTRLLGDPSPQVRAAAFRATASYANWRYQPAQQALIQRATDKSLDMDARLDAADALAQAVKLQAAGVRQDPPMFRALVSLLDERQKNEPLHAAAFIALAPIRPYIVGGSGAGQFPPDGGWEKWLDKITVEQQGQRVYYNVCKAGSSGGSGTNSQAVELFCAGENLVSTNPAKAFQSTLQAAQTGYVPAQDVVGMMYAVGKGVQQDLKEAAKWFLTAAEGGNLRAAANFGAVSRSVRGDVQIAQRWANFLSLHPEYSPVPGR
jgi:TPR repeat protein